MVRDAEFVHESSAVLGASATERTPRGRAETGGGRMCMYMRESEPEAVTQRRECAQGGPTSAASSAAGARGDWRSRTRGGRPYPRGSCRGLWLAPRSRRCQTVKCPRFRIILLFDKNVCEFSNETKTSRGYRNPSRNPVGPKPRTARLYRVCVPLGGAHCRASESDSLRWSPSSARSRLLLPLLLS